MEIGQIYYVLVKGVGFNYSAIKRVMCMGEIRQRHGSKVFSGKLVDFAWVGENYKQHPKEPETCYYNIDFTVQTFDEAKRLLAKYIQYEIEVSSKNAIQSLQINRIHLEREMANNKLAEQSWIDHIEFLTNFPISNLTEISVGRKTY